MGCKDLTEILNRNVKIQNICIYSYLRFSGTVGLFNFNDRDMYLLGSNIMTHDPVFTELLRSL